MQWSIHRYRRHNLSPAEILNGLVAFLIGNDLMMFLHVFKSGPIRDDIFLLVSPFSSDEKR